MSGNRRKRYDDEFRREPLEPALQPSGFMGVSIGSP